MNAPANPADPPMAEPGKRPTGGDVGGMAPPRCRSPGATDDEDDEDEWRHEPVAPVDEPNPLRSLGKAVGETVTGSDRGHGHSAQALTASRAKVGGAGHGEACGAHVTLRRHASPSPMQRSWLPWPARSSSPRSSSPLRPPASRAPWRRRRSCESTGSSSAAR